MKVKARRPDGNKLTGGSKILYSASSGNTGEVKLDIRGETIISFVIPSTLTSDVLTVSLQTYIGQASTPVVNQFSASIVKKDGYQVDFFLESTDNLVADVSNKVYF